MVVKFTKLHHRAKMPQKAHLQDAGFDLTAIKSVIKNDKIIYDTGIAIDLPPGYCGLVFPRSCNFKYDLLLTNSVGVIDSGYSGSIKCAFKISGNNFEKTIYNNGDRIAQLIILPLPAITFAEVEDVDYFEHKAERGAGGFGSTGK